MELIERARAGDEAAFRQLVDPHVPELQVHCYRILASFQDAEDALQETLLAAWRGLARFEGRASMRTWLYRIATTRCLNARRSATRRPETGAMPRQAELPEPSRFGEVLWLEPYPDSLLERVVDSEPGPEALYESREAISLAFVTALQLLPARQRAVLILRDVVGFHAAEVAAMLDTTEESVTSALKRARATLRAQQGAAAMLEPAPAPGSAMERELVEKLTDAWADGNLDALIALLTDDVVLAMPPLPMEFVGRDLARKFFGVVLRDRRIRLLPTRANRQPAFGVYVGDAQDTTLRAAGLLVATLSGSKVSALTRFEVGLLPHFGLPRDLAI